MALTLALVALALLVIGGLGFYAYRLWRQVWRRERQQTDAEASRRASLAEHLRVLASSLLDEQVPLIEGAIRIKVLIDNYDMTLGQDPRCQVFHQLYDATEHVPTHAGWKALDRDERRRHEANFSALELKHKAEARRSARWLLDEALPGRQAA
ncbi:DUF2489 domain-containing protein [Stutzerimonas tarimensis]|uniref:DUF2489 domain-containing protein n=1 Tax=Stutzerimonas tarimensis TaxID=1507735 RepID=A0ABV7T379_9GAMM